jgi:hypothetical protein
LNGAKPIIAPQSTTATKVADAEPRPPGRTEPGHDFGDRHPVDAIHEIDEIDQPNAPNERQRAVQPPGDGGYNAHLMWKSGDDGGNRRSLQHEAGEGPKRTHIVYHANQGEADGRCQEDCKLQLQWPIHLRQEKKFDQSSHDNSSRNDGQTPALRRRLFVRRTRVRLRERIARKQGL